MVENKNFPLLFSISVPFLVTLVGGGFCAVSVKNLCSGAVEITAPYHCKFVLQAHCTITGVPTNTIKLHNLPTFTPSLSLKPLYLNVFPS